MQKKIKSKAKEKAKSPAKKAAKKSAVKAKASGKSEVKKPGAKAKGVVIKATKSAVPVKSKSRAEKNATGVTKQRVVPHIFTHGKDRHFIPAHKEGAEIIHDGKKEEKIFHNKEEVALHQENQKVKASAVSGARIKRIFNSQGRR